MHPHPLYTPSGILVQFSSVTYCSDLGLLHLTPIWSFYCNPYMLRYVRKLACLALGKLHNPRVPSEERNDKSLLLSTWKTLKKSVRTDWTALHYYM